MNAIQNRKIGLCLFLLALVAVFGFGCGGGGGGGEAAYVAPAEAVVPAEEPVEPPPPPPPDLIVGVGFKGPIEGGAVSVYASDGDASQGALIDTTTTDADGHYAPPIDLGSYSGDVLVEISGGQYEDEATGLMVDNGDGTDDVVLHAALTGVSDTISVMVTPFTEIAYRLATQTALNVDEANYLVGAMAGVSNIVRTEPALVTEVGVCDSALQSQIEYGLLMAMISQLIENDNGIDTLDAAIQAIVNDLSPLDNYPNLLEDVGALLSAALSDFIDDDVRNQSCIEDEAQTLIDDAIGEVDEITDEPIVIPDDASSYIKTKQLIGDFRDTVQIIYNYRPDVGPRGIMETPFKDFANELQTGIVPELTDTVGRIGWIIQSALMIDPEATPPYVFYSGDGLTLTITPTADGFTFVVVEDADPDPPLDTGSLAIVYDEIAGYQYPVSGTFSAEMATAADVMTVNLEFAVGLSGGVIPTEAVLTLWGSMTAPGLTVTLYDTSNVTMNIDLQQQTVELNRIFLSTSIETETTVMTGSLDISSFVLNVGGSALPTAFTFQGSFQPSVNPTGAIFYGTVTGSWSNAATFDPSLPIDATNFRQWAASFNGTIEEPGADPERPSITVLLTVSQSEFDVFTLGAGYWRTNPDGTVVFLSGDGQYWDDPGDLFDFKVLTFSLTNQDGLVVELVISWEAADPTQWLSGTIETAGGLQTARLFTTVDGEPWVEYIISGPVVIDDEPIFPMYVPPAP
jgi:hypothetical protein